MIFIEAPPILNKSIELENLNVKDHDNCQSNDLEKCFGKLFNIIKSITYIGLRLTDEIYYYMSRGLIDPRIIEVITN